MCWKCGSTIDFSKRYYRDSTCPDCGADLHVCRGCAFYSPESHFDCRETVDELVSDKERANFCEHFKAGFNKKYRPAPASGLNAAASALFGAAAAQSQESAADKARSAFNSLFS